MIKSAQSLSQLDDLVDDEQQYEGCDRAGMRRSEVGIMPTRASIAISKAKNRSRQTKGFAERRAIGGSHRRRTKKLRW